MGPSGSGKSTLLHILGRTRPPPERLRGGPGRRYDGADDKALTRLRR